MKRLSILFINQYYYPDLAATAQLLTELCEELAQNNSITVITSFPSYNPKFKVKKRLFSIEEKSGVRILRTFSTSFSRTNMAGRLCNYLTFVVSSLLGSFFSGKQDIVATMTDPPVIGLIGFIVSRIKGSSFAYVSQDIFPEVGVVLGKLDNKFIVRALDMLNSFLLKRADAVVAVGETMKRHLVKKGVSEDKVAVIDNWANTELIAPHKKPNCFTDRYSLDDKFVVMHSGNVGLSQNLDSLVGAAKILKEREEITFVIIGDGAGKEKLKNKVRNHGLDKVIFLPYQDRNDLKYSLSAADVHVVSLKRGLAGCIVPSKIYGIMASGSAVIAAVEDECEVARMVKESKCGVVIEPEEEEILAGEILHLFGDPERVKDMGVNARVAAEKKYSKKISVGKYRKLFENIANERLEIGD